METDYSSAFVLSGNAITFPEYPFSIVPLQPSQILETITLEGTNVNTSVGVGGVVVT